MYRTDPLRDEEELRAVIGDDATDHLARAGGGGGDGPLALAIDVLRVLQGWVDDHAASAWFRSPQRRLGGRSPVDSLAAGDADEVLAAARAWVAAQS